LKKKPAGNRKINFYMWNNAQKNEFSNVYAEAHQEIKKSGKRIKRQ